MEVIGDRDIHTSVSGANGRVPCQAGGGEAETFG